MVIEDQKKIKQKIDELNLSQIEPFITNTRVICPWLPFQSYYLKVQDGGQVWEKSWNECDKEIAEPYKEFKNFIVNIIISQEEYKKIPDNKISWE